MKPRSLAIVGSQFPNKRGPTRRFEMEICAPGEPIELRLEPNNPADEHAVAVYSCRGVQLGYIPSERAVQIGALMRQGREMTAVFQAIGPTCGWLRLAFDGEVPALPATGEGGSDGDDGTGFWPDKTWDDD